MNLKIKVYLVDSDIKGNEMEGESNYGLMVRYMKDIGIIIWRMELVGLFIVMVMYTKANE